MSQPTYNPGGTAPEPALPPSTSHKAVAAGIGSLLTVLVGIIQQVAPFVPQPWGSILTGILGLLTVFGVYQTKNTPK